MPVDPTFGLGGAEWQIEPIEPAGVGGNPVQPAGGFGDMLGGAMRSLAATQSEAASAAQALATGEATDPTAVVMAVERAQLAMQLASQIRTKAVEAAQDIFHTQV
jgi:flagellar hook-basal body complex protein FliE